MSKIGIWGNDNEPTQWPTETIDGKPYHRPVMTLNIGSGKFVVLGWPKPKQSVIASAFVEPQQPSKRRAAVAVEMEPPQPESE